MFRFVAFTALLALAAGTPQKPKPFITGGQDTTIRQHPYQLALLKDNFFVCGAVLINENYALTSAYCTYGENAYSLGVRAGSTSATEGGYYVPIADIIDHPEYDIDTGINDISILKLGMPLSFNRDVQPITLTTQTYSAGTIATVTGWGHEYPGPNVAANLKVVEVPLVADLSCQIFFDYKVPSTNICAGMEGRDACNGDNGGPLVIDGVLVGITSQSVNCVYEVFLTQYTSILAVKDFIESNTN